MEVNLEQRLRRLVKITKANFQRLYYTHVYWVQQHNETGFNTVHCKVEVIN